MGAPVDIKSIPKDVIEKLVNGGLLFKPEWYDTYYIGKELPSPDDGGMHMEPDKYFDQIMKIKEWYHKYKSDNPLAMFEIIGGAGTDVYSGQVEEIEEIYDGDDEDED